MRVRGFVDNLNFVQPSMAEFLRGELKFFFLHGFRNGVANGVQKELIKYWVRLFSLNPVGPVKPDIYGNFGKGGSTAGNVNEVSIFAFGPFHLYTSFVRVDVN